MITVIGLGYVGLTTAVGLATHGHPVCGFDIDPNKRNLIQKGCAPFYEPGLKEALQESLKSGAFSAANDLGQALAHANIIMFCVPTPSDQQGIDLKPLKTAMQEALKNHKGGRVTWVVRSTIPPTTMSKDVAELINGHGVRLGQDIGLVYHPEFLREGSAWEDFTHPDRIVLGCLDEQSFQDIARIYHPFKAPVHRVSLATAEFVKYLSNAMLSTMISFSNEMASAAEMLGDIDIQKAFRILHEDHRWHNQEARMSSYVYPGCGFGGACLPKDVLAFMRKAQGIGAEMPVLEAVLKANDARKRFVVKHIKARCCGNVQGKTVAVLGLAFKPKTNDVRQSPAQSIIEDLLAQGAEIIAYDPMAQEEFKAYGLKIRYAASLDEALKVAEVAVIVTAWEEFMRAFEIFPKERILDFRYMNVESEKMP